MKIVDVAEFYAEQGGGVRTYVNQKLAAGAARGHEVVVIAPGPNDGEERRHGGRIRWVKGPPMPFDPRYFLLWNEAAVHRILDAEAPDVVEGSSPWTGGWFAARWRGAAARAFIFHQDPVAVYPETFLAGHLGVPRVNQLFGWYWAYLRTLSRRFDATVVAGPWLARKLSTFGLKHPVAVPFGIEKHRFAPGHWDHALRRELLARCRVEGDGKLLVTISRFHPEKRLPTLFDGFAALRRRRPGVGWVIFGDGPLRRQVEARAAATEGCHLAGFTKDRELLARTLASADALFHGSAAETFGLVVAEALCSGLPLVVPDRGGAADLSDPAYAETYPPGDGAAAARAIERLLARSADDLRGAALRAGEGRVKTVDEHFDELFGLYASLPRNAP